MATPFTEGLHYISLCNWTQWKGSRIYIFCVHKGEREGLQALRKEKRIFFFSICLLPGWIWVKKKWKSPILWILWFISERPNEIWPGPKFICISVYTVLTQWFAEILVAFSPVHWGLPLATQAWSIWLRGKSQNSIFKNISCQKRKVKTLEWMIFPLFQENIVF